jgi:pyridoxal phosphate enzyme (YggS family)
MNQPLPPSITEKQVKSNYLALMEKVADALKRTGRPVNTVQVIGVTKYVDVKLTQYLVNAGCHHLAESRPQALWAKSAELADQKIDWHLIGHLQRNKAKRTVPILSTMHSLDSERLLQQIESDLDPRTSPLQLLLEVNISGDVTKTGIAIAEAELLLTHWMDREHRPSKMEIAGLMGMGSLTGSPDTTRREFSLLRELRDTWSSRFGLPLAELSMGMSDDFEIAIEEGSTMVRIGSLLFQHPEAENVKRTHL